MKLGNSRNMAKIFPSSVVGPKDSPIEGTKKAKELFREARRYICLGELELALENIDFLLTLSTVDDKEFNRADALFLASQICRRLKDYDLALKYIKAGIDQVDPYRPDSPKFVLCQGVINMQLADRALFTKRSKYLKKAKESLEIALNVCEVFLSGKSDRKYTHPEQLVIRKYHQIALFDMAYTLSLTGNDREAIVYLDTLFEKYPGFSVEGNTYRLFEKIYAEKKVSRTAN